MKVLQVILSFSLLVIVHEFGHYITARWFKCRVEKFYLFFNPYFSVFRKKIGQTEYGIGWIPFGGYVKIAGMVDESMDKGQLQAPPQGWEFRSKKPWQKVIVMSAGVMFNFLLAFVIYVGISYFHGRQYVANKDLVHGLHFSDLAKQMGFEDGDIITTVEGHPTDDYRSAVREMVLREARTVTVLRNNRSVDINLPEGYIQELSHSLAGGGEPFVSIRFAPFIQQVSDQAHFQGEPLRENDKILSVDNTLTPYTPDVVRVVRKHKNAEVAMAFLRGQDTIRTVAQVDGDGKIGIQFNTDGLRVTQMSYGFWGSIGQGAQLAVKSVGDYFRQIGLLFFSKEVKVSESLGSVISVGKIFPSSFSAHDFFMITAFLSIMIGLVNLLPIPALDGGHIVFALYEWVVGKAAPQKVLEYSQMIGMFLLFGLMLYALGLDITRLFA